MSNGKFVYVTYIRTTPEKLWQALTEKEFTRAYWNGTWHDTDWRPGSPWKLMFPDGRVADAGEVVEVEKPRRIVLRWRNEFMPELKAEGFSRCAFDIEAMDDTVRLTITHEIGAPDSKFITAVSGGWPKILASLKSLLETGNALEAAVRWPKPGAEAAHSAARH